MAQRAVFLDRDNTIIADPGYQNDPDAVQLLPGAADSVRRLNEAGYSVVIVTNQSGVARGRITEQQLTDIHERLREMLLEQGARIDAIYYCPYLPGVEATVPRFRKESPLRKPEPGMLLRAADELQLALAGSWMIGDSARDVTAGRRAGCRTILIKTSAGADTGACQPDYATDSLSQAVDIVLAPPPLIEASPAAPSNLVVADPAVSRSAPDGDLEATLAEMRDLLRRLERRERQEDFSVARLLATLAQMLAFAAGIWGVVALIGNKPAGDWIMLAVLLQLMVLAALGVGRR